MDSESLLIAEPELERDENPGAVTQLGMSYKSDVCILFFERAKVVCITFHSPIPTFFMNVTDYEWYLCLPDSFELSPICQLSKLQNQNPEHCQSSTGKIIHSYTLKQDCNHVPKHGSK